MIITKCTRCGTEWTKDYEYCPKCEPILAQAERRGVKSAFDDRGDCRHEFSLLYNDGLNCLNCGNPRSQAWRQHRKGD